MANEFKVKKGLIVEGSGSVVLDIQGSQGQLFSITDDLTGDLFSVSDISGVPILNVNADGTSTFDGNVILTGPETLDSTSDTSIKFLTRDSNGVVKYHTLGSNAFNSNTYNNYSLPLGTTSTRGGFKIGYTESGKNYPVELSSEKMFVNVPWTDTNTVYTHPTHPGDDINIDTTALEGATVISDLDFNITTDTSGHVTDANGTVATRTLTLKDLGYTGATDANNFTYTLPAGSSLTRGGFKIGFAESGKNYPVEVSSEKMYVNVPWTDNNTQRAIHDTPVDGATTTSISSNWAFDNVKKAVPSNALFTDTNTQRSDEDITKVISDAGFKTTDNNTQLSTADVRGKISGTGLISYNNSTGVISTTANNVTNNNQLTNGAGYRTSAQVDAAIQAVVDAAPAALDTLNEIAASLGDDADFAGSMTTALAGKLSTSGKAADSNLLDGLDLHTGRNNVANRVVRTNSSGYLDTGWINTTSGTASGTLTRIYCSQDDYLRYLTPTNFRNSIISAGTNVQISSTGVISSTNTNTQLSDGDIEKMGYIKTYTDTNTQLSAAQVRANFSAGTNVAISSGGVISSTDTNTTYSVGDGGLTQKNFTTTLKTKLDGIATSANNYSHPTGAGNNHIPTGGSSGQFLKYSSSGTAVWASDNNTTYSVGDGGLTQKNFTTTLKSKLDGITAGATPTDTTNVVKALTAGTNIAISSEGVISSTDTNTTYSVGAGGLTQQNFTTTLKNKLDALDSSTYLKSNADDTFSGGLVSTARDEGIFGTYDSYKTDHIWSMGTAYKNHASGTNFGNLYGLAYKHTNNTTGGTMAGGHQMVWCDNGTGKSAMGTNIWTSGTVTASGGNSANWNTAYGWGNHASAGYKTTDNNTWRGIHDTPVDGATTTSISSNWAFDNVKKAVPSNALFTDTNTQLSAAQVRANFSAGTNVAISSGGVISSTDTNTQLSDGDIEKMGYIKTYTDTNTQLSAAQVRANFSAGTNVQISSTGVISATDTNTNTQLTTAQVRSKVSAGTGISYNSSTGVITNTVTNTNTQLSDEAVAEIVTKAGFIKTDTNTQLSAAQVRANFSAGTNVSITSAGVISSTDTNTTYSVGDGGLTQKNFTSTLKTKLDGIAASANNYSFPYTVSAGASNSTVVQRNGNGYIFASYFNGTGTFSTSGATSGMGLFTGTNGTDTYGRSYTAAAARALLNVADGATNVTNNSQIANGRGYITSYTDTNTQLSDEQVAAIVTKAGFVKTDTNTTYTADGNYGITLSGTTFRLEDDRRRNSTGTDVYSGNTHDFTWYDASVGIRWYTAGSEDMRLLDNGTLHVDGDVVAYSSTISDERLKDNIKTIENPLDKIKALRGVEYDWNNGNRKGKHDLGLIAQEVESVIPDIVHEHTLPYVEGEEDTLYKTVDYEKMVAVLIEGMKEQQTQIDSLKSELTEIKGKL